MMKSVGFFQTTLSKNIFPSRLDKKKSISVRVNGPELQSYFLHESIKIYFPALLNKTLKEKMK